MSRFTRVVASFGALTLALVIPGLARAATPADHTVADDAAAWLADQQQPDGSFELVGFFGFETRDAALAIAEAAQTGSTWSTSEARAALGALHGSGTGNPSALDALDAFAAAITPGADFTSAAGNAAKTIVLSARPLGLDPADFDANDDGTGVDLLALLDDDCGSDILTFTDLLYGMLADVTLCGHTPAQSAAVVRAAQQANGGWNYLGSPSMTVFDPDTTGLAVQALVATGVRGDDPQIAGALAFAATEQQSDGGWIDAFAVESNPGSTSVIINGIRAAGYDPTSPCWRNTVAPSLVSAAYVDPITWLRSQQQNDGHIRSPYDGQGFDNTVTTSEGVHAILGNQLPEVRDTPRNCIVNGPAPVVSTSTPTAGGTMTVSGSGFMPGTTVTVQLFSTPVLLATVVADGSGAYSVVVTIPGDTATGPHEIVVSGLGPDGQLMVTTAPIEVAAPGSTTASDPVVQAVVVTPRLTG